MSVRRLIISESTDSEVGKRIAQAKREKVMEKLREGRAKNRDAKAQHVRRIVKIIENGAVGYKFFSQRTFPVKYCYSKDRLPDGNFYAFKLRFYKTSGEWHLLKHAGYKKQILARKYAYRWMVRENKMFSDKPALRDHILKGSCKRPWVAFTRDTEPDSYHCSACEKRNKKREMHEQGKPALRRLESDVRKLKL